ncbi:transporter, auxin efflux carrier domain protein [Bordetella bronchiseptica CA90 BB1334]|nr:transporter, auxin efflux carrier domain protein [Bordetella bronchiseptica OSU054]KDB71429.1 transporter, auxin efflux carrier domain protein [Bordetella bronchiseptica CA90 BB1334]KDC20875.1 transporter, auxin efflux carrier domain protein [Bordetella bronchiseptica F-1]KDC25747.1 transporter, auxin efflux carrier domain protein [Bordetella bronchiseptica F2]KDD40923.1 transporter, auxin efflux carrier domain protein [Bordetella bronchiseptica OSU095]
MRRDAEAPLLSIFFPGSMSVALLVLPDFMLVALGWALRHKLGFSREFFAGTERMVYFVLFPALLFQSILRTPISAGHAMQLLQATAALMACGVALAWLAGPVLRPAPVALASAAQCGYRFNTYIGLALAASLAGGPGQTIMALIVGFAVPMANVAAVYGLARHSGNGLLRELARNPLLVSTLLGLACNLAGLSLPGPIDTVMARLGAAALALGIMCVGASLAWEGGKGHGRLIGWMLAVKLAAMPSAALGIAWALGLPALETRMLVLFSALPTASAAYVLAMRMGGDGRMVAVLISLGTLASAATIPLWLTAAAGLGAPN